MRCALSLLVGLLLASTVAVAGPTIPAAAVPLRPGGGLSVRTPVARPGSVKGARSWTIETRRHRWAPTALALAPDGTIAATGGYDGMVRLWDAATGALLRVLVGHDSYVYGLGWSADGRYLASSGSFDLTVRIWEARTGLPLKVLKGFEAPPGPLAWSPDGAFLAAGTYDSGYVHVFKAATGALARKIANGKPVLSLTFAPDGQALACAVSEVGVTLAASPTWKAVKLDLPALDALAVAYTADGKGLVIGGNKDTVVWDLAGRKVSRRLGTAAGALARHGSRLAVSTPAGRVWDLATAKPGANLPPGVAVGWSGDGKTLCILSGDDVVRVDPEKGTELKRWSVAESGSLLWSLGRPILSGLGTLRPRLWDTATGKPQHALPGHASVAAWSPTGKLLATGGADRTVRVWNPTTGKLVRTLSGLAAPVAALAIAGDGKIAVAVGREVVVYPADGTKPLRTFTGHTDAVRCLAWTRDGSLASGAADALIHVWGLKSAKPLRTVENGGAVECLAFAPGGKALAAGSPENRVRIWTYPTRKLVHEFNSPGSPPAITALAWSPDAALVLAGRANHVIQLWDVKSGKDRHSIVAMAPVHAVAWGAGGKTMVSCSLDRSIRFWNAATGQIHATVVAAKEQLACVSTEGHYRVPNEAETELVYVVLTAKGMDTLPLPEFRAKFGW
jgi:WD40 repeat protein